MFVFLSQKKRNYVVLQQSIPLVMNQIKKGVIQKLNRNLHVRTMYLKA